MNSHQPLRVEEVPEITVKPRAGEKVLRVALAGQPNVGKSTVFNMLTGLSQHVGNWPGKTVEKKSGRCRYGNYLMHIVDLPGTYSLTANSIEERIARDYIVKERPDVVVAIVNAATLERSLYLVAELLLLPSPVVLGLNMMDVAEQQGYRIDVQILQAKLGIPVVPMVASKNQGVKELLEAVIGLAEGIVPYNPRQPEIKEAHKPILEKLRELMNGLIPEPYPLDWVAIKLLEGDSEVTELVKGWVDKDKWGEISALLKGHEDAILDIAGGRYEWIRKLVKAAVEEPRMGPVSLTERLDRVATHPFWGLVVMALVLGAIFWLTYTIGSPIQSWLEESVIASLANLASSWLSFLGAPAWLNGLVVDGIIGGIGTVLSFFPILAVFFAVFGLLEDVGYLARAAYVMDRFMHWMGLHGKSFLPLFLGFGCNVPAVLGSRIIEEKRARLLTIFLTPFIPCSARMAVLVFLTPVFFGERAFLVSWGLILLNLAILALVGKAMNSLLFKGERLPFIMELPLYHYPNFRTIGLEVWHRVASFLRKAGTVILAVSVVVWALSYWPTGSIEGSFLAKLGVILEPLGRLAGLDSRMVVALLTSFVAKENAVATLGVLYGAGEEALASVLGKAVPPRAGFAFLVMEMLFIPCVATVSAMRQELGSWRWTFLVIGFYLALSFAAGILVYHVFPF
jgi:ferrous iron transport protein B